MFFMLPSLLSAQVVNTEKLRINRSEKGITGQADLSLGLNRNKAGQTIRFGVSFRLEWLRAQSRWLALGGIISPNSERLTSPRRFPKNSLTMLMVTCAIITAFARD